MSVWGGRRDAVQQFKISCFCSVLDPGKSTLQQDLETFETCLRPYFPFPGSWLLRWQHQAHISPPSLPAFPALPRHFAMQIQLHGLTLSTENSPFHFAGAVSHPMRTRASTTTGKKGIWNKAVPLVSLAPPVTWSCVLSTLPWAGFPGRAGAKCFLGELCAKRGWNADLGTHWLWFFFAPGVIGMEQILKFTESERFELEGTLKSV